MKNRNASIKANGIRVGKPKYDGKVEFEIKLGTENATLYANCGKGS